MPSITCIGWVGQGTTISLSSRAHSSSQSLSFANDVVRLRRVYQRDMAVNSFFPGYAVMEFFTRF